MKLRPSRVELSDANAFVERLHRHHDPVVGHRFSVGVEDETGTLRGVAICGRPVAKNTDKRNILEVTRCCTDGTKHAPSMLYGAATRMAREMAFRRIQTFILPTEPGTTLKACGWRFDGMTDPRVGRQHSRPGRKSTPHDGPKQRWVLDLSPPSGARGSEEGRAR